MSLLEGCGTVLQPVLVGMPAGGMSPAAFSPYTAIAPASVLYQPLPGFIAGVGAASARLWQTCALAASELRSGITSARVDLTYAAIQLQLMFGDKMDLVSFALASAFTGHVLAGTSPFSAGAAAGTTRPPGGTLRVIPGGAGAANDESYHMRVLGPDTTPIGDAIKMPKWVGLVTTAKSRVGKEGGKMRGQVSFDVFAQGERHPRLTVVFDDRWSISAWSFGVHSRAAMLRRFEEILNATPMPAEGTRPLVFERGWRPPAPTAAAAPVSVAQGDPGAAQGGRPLATPDGVVAKLREWERKASEDAVGTASNAAIDMGYMVRGNPAGLAAFIEHAGTNDFAAEVLAMFISVYYSVFGPDQIPLLDAIGERVEGVRDIMATSRELGRFPPRV